MIPSFILCSPFIVLYLTFLDDYSAQRKRSECFKVISVYINKAISSVRRYLRERHSTYALGIATLELELFRQRLKTKELYGTYRLKTDYLDISITVLKFLKCDSISASTDDTEKCQGRDSSDFMTMRD